MTETRSAMQPRAVSNAPSRRIRLLLVLASWLYVLAFHYAYVNYLIVEWAYWGFTYRPPESKEIALMALLVTLGAVFMPAALERGSSVILLLLYLTVYLPVVMVTLSLDKDGIELYGEALGALAIAFCMVCIVVRYPYRTVATPSFVAGQSFTTVIMLGWLVCFVTLAVTYWSIIGFAGLDAIYEQRARGTASDALTAYMQTYLGFVISPALITIGITGKKFWPIFWGTAGCLLMYLITAQRTLFLLPAGLLGLHFLLRRRNPIFRSTALPTFAIAAAIFLTACFWNESDLAQLVCNYLTGRTVAVPGLTFSQYHDVFTREGFTWWTHVRGIGGLVAPPKLAEDELWPRLGNIVGDRVYNKSDVNVNANLFSSDGLAAAGTLGVIVIGLLFAIYLRFLDRISAKWDSNFVILAVFPVGLALTNAPFWTTMLSFGGLFWLLVFRFWPTPLLSKLAGKPAGGPQWEYERL
jgi:hypothetical protein